MDNSASFPERIVLQLRGMRGFLAGLSGRTMDRVPDSPAEVSRFLSRVLSCLTALAIFHEVLYRRLLSKERVSPGINPVIERALLSIDLPRRQRPARAIESELWARLEELNSTLGYLSYEELEFLPDSFEDLPEALALVLTIEKQLIWYLDVYLAKRLISPAV